MREPKFRAWDIEAKCYVKEPILVDNFGQVYVVCEEASNIKGTCLITHKPNVVLEQYTDLEDKNSKEIYEGDIVDYNNDGECIGVVKYDAPEFYLDADATNWARMFLKGAPHQKVIGNIHENPELLEEEKWATD